MRFIQWLQTFIFSDNIERTQKTHIEPYDRQLLQYVIKADTRERSYAKTHRKKDAKKLETLIRQLVLAAKLSHSLSL